MVDLPGVPRRLVTTDQTRSRVTAEDVAGPFRRLSQALDSFVPGAIAVESELGERAGFEKAITTGADGLPQVQLMPPLSGAYAAGYNRAASMKYIADLGSAVERQVQEARQEFAGNPAGFDGWAKGYVKDLAKREKDPHMKASVEKMALGATDQAWRGISTEHQREVVAGALTSLKDRRAVIESQMAALARQGATGSPEYAELMDDYDAIGEELANNAALGVPKEAVDADTRSMVARQEAEALIGALGRRGAPRATPQAEIVDRIIGVESGGDVNARPVDRQTGKLLSSAAGAGQFIDSTWVDMIRRHRPDLASGRSEAEILALRSDPEVGATLGREMTTRYAEENIDSLARAGHTATAGNVYLAHFLGAGGAVATLDADPNTPIRQALIEGGIRESVADQMIAANRGVLEGRTAGQVRAWAGQKMGQGDDAASLIEETFWNPELDLSPEERRRYVSWAHTELNRAETERTKRSSEIAESHERLIIDGAAGLSPMPSRNDIANDPDLTESARNTLLRQFDTANKDVIEQQQAFSRFSRADGGNFNAFDSDDRKALDHIYKSLGSDGAALKAIVERTGTAPPAAVKQLRGGTASVDPTVLGPSLQAANALMLANPTAFAGHDGGGNIEKAATAFRHYVDDLGYSAEEATAKVAQMNTPEFKADINAKVRGEDFDQMLRDKKLPISDLQKGFDQIVIGRSDIGANPGARAAMYSDYAELTRDRYLETGDLALSKTYAIDQLKRTWGESRVNGSSIIMRYPPDKAPGMEKIEDPAEVIAEDLLESIQADHGVAADRSSIALRPIPGVTATAFKSGGTVPYDVLWLDENGLPQQSQPGRPYVVDPSALARRQTESRADRFKQSTDRRDRLDRAAEQTTQTLRGIESSLFGRQ